MSLAMRAGVTIPDGVKLKVKHFVIQNCYQDDIASVIITEEMIRNRIKQLSNEIHDKIGDQELTIICVLKGSYRFFTHLVEELTVARNSCKTTIHVEFIQIKSYNNVSSTGKVEVLGFLNLEELRGKNVLIVEDIIDSGLTLSQLLNKLKDLGVVRVWTSILLSKRVERTVECPEDFVAFNVPNKFLVGYGLDYNQAYRDLNYICVINSNGIAKFKK